MVKSSQNIVGQASFSGILNCITFKNDLINVPLKNDNLAREISPFL